LPDIRSVLSRKDLALLTRLIPAPDNHIGFIPPPVSDREYKLHNELSLIAFIKRKSSNHPAQQPNQLLKDIMQIQSYFLLIIL
jgi:hypothetical protein